MKKAVISVSQACDAHRRAKAAEGKSKHTLDNYRTTYNKLQAYLGADPPFKSVTVDQLVGFFAWLRDSYEAAPAGVAPRPKRKLSSKTILNVHTDLSALWTWGVKEGYVPTNIVRKIAPPDAKPPVIEPFTQAECEAMVAACAETRPWKSRPQTKSSRATSDRDETIVRMLTDTGLRAAELVSIKIADVNQTTRSIKVVGKGRRERVVQYGKRTARALDRYLMARLREETDTDYLFVVGAEDDLRPMTRDYLHRLIKRIGERAGVANAHPHKFRHTFGVEMIRNGATEMAVQDLLGHADASMTRRYVHLVQADLAKVHEQASPVDRWRL